MPVAPRSADHIITVAQHLRGGGVERAMLRLARGWLAMGRRVTLVAGSLDGPLAAELPAGLETVELGAPSAWPLFALPRLVEERRPDLIFCPGNFYTAVAAWTKLRLGRRAPPIVGKMSNAADRGDHGRIAGAAHRLWLAGHGRFLDELVAMTPATAAAAERALHMEGRVSVIPNPPALPLPDAMRPPLPTGRFILGVGRLAPQKRWDRLIDALPHLADGQVALAIIGEGELRRDLQAQIRALGLEGRVTMPGHAADPLGAMAAASVLALTSDYEGVPGVLREALSVGTPVVATDSSPAVPEIVAAPHLGTVVGRNDRPALVRALDHWLAPGVPRPAPVPQPGADAAERYLALFDRLVSRA